MNKTNNQRQILFLFKAIATAVVLLCASPAEAGDYKLLREGDPTEKAYFLDTNGVCFAMEQNLKKFQDRPYGMACKRELDPALGFSRPEWEKLDVMQHIPLVVEIMRFNRWDKDFLSTDSRLWPSQIRDLVDKRRLGLDLARVDLDGDGKLDNLVRFGFDRPCLPADERDNGKSLGHRRLFVVDSSVAKVDRYMAYVSPAIEDDVFLYKGVVYSDTFWGMPFSVRKNKKRDGTLKIFEFGKRGTADICTFHYFESAAVLGENSPRRAQ